MCCNSRVFIHYIIIAKHLVLTAAALYVLIAFIFIRGWYSLCLCSDLAELLQKFVFDGSPSMFFFQDLGGKVETFKT